MKQERPVEHMAHHVVVGALSLEPYQEIIYSSAAVPTRRRA
jgi:hypothetical protein